MIDWNQLQDLPSASSTSNGEPTLHVTATDHGTRIRFNKALAKKLGIDENFFNADGTVQIVYDAENCYIGKDINENCRRYTVKGNERQPILYSSKVGSDLLSLSRKKIEPNKTIAFVISSFETGRNGDAIAVIKLK